MDKKSLSYGKLIFILSVAVVLGAAATLLGQDKFLSKLQSALEAGRQPQAIELVRANPKSARAAIRVLLRDSMKTKADEKQAKQKIALAEQIASVYEEATGNAGYSKLVTTYASWSDEQRSEKEKADALLKSGVVAFGKRDRTKALENWQSAKKIYRKLGAKLLQADATDIAAIVCKRLRKYKDALTYYRESLAIKREMGDPEGEAYSLLGIGDCLDGLEQYLEALNSYKEAVALYKKLKDSKGQAEILNKTGIIYKNLARYDEALDSYRQALKIFDSSGDERAKGIVLNNIGAVLEKQSKYEEAEANCKAALTIAEKKSDKRSQAGALTNLGIICKNTLCYKEALTYYERSLKLSRETGDKLGELGALANIGTLYEMLADHKRAIENYEAALKIAERVHSRARESDVLNNLGSAYMSLGQYEKSLAAHREALEIARDLGDKPGVAAGLGNMGGVHLSQGDYAQALENFEASLKQYQEIGMKRAVGEALSNIGMTYQSMGDYREALAVLQDALKIHRELNSKIGEGATLNAIAGVYHSWGDYDQAESYYEKALKVAEEIGDKSLEANVLANEASIHTDLGEYEDALSLYEKALAVHESLGHKNQVASLKMNMAGAYSDIGDPDRAWKLYEESLATAKQIGDRNGQAYVLHNMAKLHRQWGEYDRAAEKFNESLALKREIGDKRGEANTLNSLGSLFESMGEYQKALTFYNESLAIRRDIGDKKGEAGTLNNIGIIWKQFGLYPRAKENYESALKIFGAAKNVEGESSALLNLGILAENAGFHDEALDYYDKALDIARRVGLKGTEQTILNNMSIAHREAGNLEKALANGEAALKIAQALKDPEAQAIALNTLGNAHLDMDRLNEAERAYQSAMSLASDLDSPELLWSVTHGLASVAKEKGDLGGAIKNCEKSIEIIEDLRRRLTVADYKAGFLTKKIFVYEEMTDLLVQRYQRDGDDNSLKLAFHYTERMRARAFLDLLSTARVEIREGVDGALLAKEKAARRRLSYLQSQLRKEYTKTDGKSTPTTEDLMKKLKAADEVCQNIEEEIALKSPQYAGIYYPQPLTLDEVRKLGILDDQTALLEYSLGKKRSFLWVVTKDSHSVYELPSREALESAVETFRSCILDRESVQTKGPFQKTGDGLYAALIEPAQQMVLGKKKLLIVPDGILNYMPFEALPASWNKADRKGESPRYLIEDFAINYVQSATVMAEIVKRRRRAPIQWARTFLAFADPTYGGVKGASKVADLRTIAGAAYGNLSQLPHTREEVNAISEIIASRAGSNKATITKYIGDDAKEERVKASDTLGDYRYIHFATHGVLVEDSPQLSSLVLALDEDDTEDGFLQMREIFDLKLNADLVVLSACKTALGKDVKGEGIVGLTRAFMYAGAPSAVVSLWSVSDRSTAELMRNFYGYLPPEPAAQAGLFEPANDKAEALRLAKLDMIHGRRALMDTAKDQQRGGFEIESEKPKAADFSHPYYWAAFVIVGSGK